MSYTMCDLRDLKAFQIEVKQLINSIAVEKKERELEIMEELEEKEKEKERELFSILKRKIDALNKTLVEKEDKLHNEELRKMQQNAKDYFQRIFNEIELCSKELEKLEAHTQIRKVKRKTY